VTSSEVPTKKNFWKYLYMSRRNRASIFGC